MAAEAAERVAYLIAIKQPLVAQDLAEAIAEHDPGAQVIFARDPDDAGRQLATSPGPLVLAFLGMSPAALAASGLVGILEARGAQVVLLGTEAEDQGEGPGWWVLQRPFTSDCIAMLLHRAGRLAGTAHCAGTCAV